MAVVSYEVSPERIDKIRDLTFRIENILKDGREWKIEQLFKSLFEDPNFPNQPIVSESAQRENFELAMSSFGLNKYEKTESTIKLRPFKP